MPATQFVYLGTETTNEMIPILHIKHIIAIQKVAFVFAYAHARSSDPRKEVTKILSR